MQYDFETLINRHHTGSCKWNDIKKINPNISEEIVPFSVADVDMKLAPEIHAGLLEFMQKDPIFGYSEATDDYYQAVIKWLAKRHQFNISKEAIVLSNGIVTALNNAVASYSKINEGVIIFTPVYHPFYQVITLNNRQIVKCPLINHEHHYEIDFSLFETVAQDPNNKMLLLCSPHNPVGRVWTKTELMKIAKICLDNNITIISDEIHADLIMPKYKHLPIASLSPEISNITVTCTAPSKTFNLAGLQASNIIIENEVLRNQFIATQKARSFSSLNTLAFEAVKLSYTKGEPWLNEFIKLIDYNYHLLSVFIRESIPKAILTPLEGTYLAWLDLRAYGFDSNQLEKIMHQANLYFDEGIIFGEEGSGFERINIACPSKTLLVALKRLATALNENFSD